MEMKIITPPFRIKPEPTILAPAVERLYAEVFGPARFAKASHQFRAGRPPTPGLSWIAVENDRVIGAIRYWPVGIGETDHPALLLGPLAIAHVWRNRGIGTALVCKTLDLARRAGHDLILLVGDRDYYERFGFAPATPYGLAMAEEKRPERLQVLSLAATPLGRVRGDIHPAIGVLPKPRRYRPFALASGKDGRSGQRLPV